MIRTSAAIYFCCSAIVFFIQAAEGQNASNPNSVVDYYQNLFHGRPAAGVSAAPGSCQLSQPENHRPFIAPSAESSFQLHYDSAKPIDVDNAFGQWTPTLEQTLEMPSVDHSRLIQLINLSRGELLSLVRNGASPTLPEMDGLWYGFNTGRIPERLGFSQFIKDLRTNSDNPTGSNVRVHQVARSQLNSGNGWRPRFDADPNQLKREGTFAVLPPDGIGEFGHAAKGVYALGRNPVLYPGNHIRTRIVKLDDDFMVGQSTLRVGIRYVHAGFFVLQRMPPTSWNQR